MKSISLPVLLSLAVSISAAPLEQSILINPSNDGLRPMEEAMISTLSTLPSSISSPTERESNRLVPTEEAGARCTRNRNVMEMSFRSTTLGIRICAIKTGAIGLIATIVDLRIDGLGVEFN
ncbi:hypothetical protein ACJ73_05485 [Blastomyces percursus]|uniref:Uncharacterized protein n=1 Tax=Blastomyces percursus TaxID=1658174 RepID=A0A1J9Q3R5_9EURO|nr:hypothetical protein ACJ73_05485 [Blastomyces percursus]